MISVDEDALICDLAETYRIYDYKSLPCNLVATFSCGLGDDSRIKQKLSGMPTTLENLLLATIADGVNALVWLNSKNGATGHNRPKSIVEMLKHPESAEKKVMSFESGDDFIKYREQLLRKIQGGV